MAMKLAEIDVAIGSGATSFSQEPLIVRGGFVLMVSEWVM